MNLATLRIVGGCLWVFGLSVAAGCGGGPAYEDYKLTSQADLLLTQQNHPHGHRQSECFHCHVRTGIHQVDRLGSPLFGMARTLVDQSGLASCSGCHGRNGL